jgi:hypothetical protein
MPVKLISDYIPLTWRNIQFLDAHDGLVEVVVNSYFEACVVSGQHIVQLNLLVT